LSNSKQGAGDEYKSSLFKKKRLQKILSDHGVVSRREAERMILEGRVHVNGIQATLGQSAEFGIDDITIDGVTLAAGDEPVYIMLNKPRGYITTVNDEKGRKTVMSLIRDVDTRVYPIGRLDMNTEGLLLLTNDGDFANTIAHPSYEKRKTYEVKVRGDARKIVQLMRLPIKIDDYMIQAKEVSLSKITEDGGVIRITITEGRNRQIHKMCAVCGAKVQTLKRVSVGTLKLGSLKPGQWRYLTGEEVHSLWSKKALP